MCGVIFIEELPRVRLDPNGATLEYVSGDETFLRRYPLPIWRALLEREMARLGEYDADLRKRVVPIRKGERRRH